MTKKWTISDRDGNVLYQGEAESKKLLIQELVQSGKSMARADLRNLNLSHLDISGGDFSGADLSGASIRGCIAKGTVFDGAILNGCRAEGMMATGASFRNAVIGVYSRRGRKVQAVLDGAVLTHSRFDAAVMEQVSFEGCSAAGASFCLAQLLDVSFKDSRLHNVDWTRSRIMRCSFKDAELHATTAAMRIPRASLPNRSRECVAVGNDFGGAILDDTTPAFSRDKTLNRISGQLAWAVSTAAMVVAAMHLPIEPSQDWFGQTLGQGVLLASALTVATLAKEKVAEFIQEHLSDYTLQAQMAMRSTVSDMIRRGGNLVNAVVAMGKARSIAPLVEALRATADGAHRDPALKAVSRMAIGDVDVIVCDRRRLAMALEWISTSFHRTAMLDRDFLVVRTGPGDGAPRMLKFFAGGGMAAIWSDGARSDRIVVWDESEMTPAYSEVEGLTGALATHVRRQFERAVLDEHLPSTKFEYDPTKQQLRAGMDGSIVITDMRNQLPKNKEGVILVRPEGGAYTESGARDLMGDDDMPLAIRR